MFSRYFAATLWIFCAVSASAQRLGQTKDEVIAESGPASEENHSKGTAVYRHKWLKIEVTYDNGVARKLVCTSLDPLNDDVIGGILKLNAGGGSWHEMNVSGSTRFWQGPNFAQAKCDRVRPRVLTLSGGVTFPSLRSTPAAVSTTAATSRALVSTPPRSAGQNVVNQTVSVMAGGLIAALFAVAFPLIVVGLAAAFIIKSFIPWLLRRHANAPAEITQRRTDPANKWIVSPRQARLVTPPPVEPIVQTPTLDSLTWDNFELLIGEVFRRKGYSVEINSGLGADGGKDLTLRTNDELAVVQCKKLASDNRVTATQMRDFFGLIIAEGATKGFFVTTGYFSADAKRFAAGKPIELIERSALEKLVSETSAPGENLYDISSWIDAFVSRANVVDPICPFCERPMKLRRGALGKLFWGCPSFPRCKGNRAGREQLLQARQWQGR
jgi:hypothetical protein